MNRDNEPTEPADLTTTGDDAVDFLTELVVEGADIAAQPTPIAPGLWAVYGEIAYEGETVLAEFRSIEEAKSMLDRIVGPGRREEER